MSTLTIFTPAVPAAVTVPASRASQDRRIPAVLGSDLEVPIKGGRLIPYANLDYAASAPCLAVPHILRILESGSPAELSAILSISAIPSGWTVTSHATRRAGAAARSPGPSIAPSHKRTPATPWRS